MSYLNTEIDRVRTALLRHEAVCDRMSQEWADSGAPCCPNCMFGAEYSDAADKGERTRTWLVHLLEKRGRPEDLREARSRRVDGVIPQTKKGKTSA